ncbi:MAG: 5'-3' exonuclease H3TH domain-containing protein, partial [Pseudomonadota bacterium]
MTKTRKSKPADARPNRNWVPDGEAVPVGKGSHVYLVDGSAYIFRAFHALPPLTRPSDGLPVGAVHGFCQMLWKLLDESKLADRPTHLAVIFDHSAETFRNEIYSDYKAQRPDPPEELVPQFPLIRDAVVAFNVACIEQAGFEADDLIATYARAADAAGADVTIVSSDKDLMQLVSPGIKMFDGMKNVILGEDEVFEKFGVEPGRVVDVQALAGDSVDNVPGVPGIGIKTAAQLIQEYGDLDMLLARAEEIKQPKRREKLIAFADQARVSRQLVTLKDDVPLEVSAPDIGIQDPVSETLLGFLQEMEFNTLTRRIADAMGVEPPARLEASVGSSVAGKQKANGRKGAADGTAAKPNGAASNGAGTPQAVVEAMAAKATAVPIDREAYETVVDVDALKTWIGEAREARAFAFDTETSSLDAMQADLVGFSIATAPGRACYVPVGHSASDGGLDFGDGEGLKQLDLRVALAELKPLLEDRAVLKIGQNIKYDALVLRRYGIRVVSFDDTMLLSYALDGGRGGHGMDDLATRHLGHACLPFKQIIALAPGKKIADKTFAGVPIDKATEYAAEDADVTLRLWMILKARIAAERMATVYETLERPLVDVIVDMEEAGISVDRTILSRLSGS